MKRVLLSALLLGAVMVAHAGPPPASISDARMRWLPGDLPLAGYFVLTSHSEIPLRLLSAASPAFGRVMLHRSLREGGVDHMVHVDGVDLAPGQSVAFAPGGYHLMLMDRRRPLRVGEEVPVTLHFSDGQTLEAGFRVMGPQGE
jgi:copper(I)-binding protein